MFDELSGDHSVRGFREVTLPDSISYAPQTAGWYILLGLALALVSCLLIHFLLQWHRNRYRRYALLRLGTIERDIREPSRRADALAALPALVKRTALACFPREEVADLSGEAWLKFLDQTYSGRGFTKGAGRLLPVLSYQGPAKARNVPEADARALISLTETWIRKHKCHENQTRRSGS